MTGILEKKVETSARLRQALAGLLHSIYPEQDPQKLAENVIECFWPEDKQPRKRGRIPGNTIWNENDTYLITYGNSLTDGIHKPLDLLWDFAERYLKGVVNGIHILPYFPFTSDDGFAITDYRAVNSVLGDWHDINRIAADFRVMSDLVLNHCSSQSRWFSEYLQGHSPYDQFFFEASPEDDLSDVVRPRTHPLLREVETANGKRYVWCTFSHDQVDFDFSNPEVLLEFIRIMRFQIDQGVRTLRLDAVAFLWKQIGTSCIHLRQTHEIIRLMRLLTDYAEEKIILITETNVPNLENLSYFGNRNEAHVIYNFSLPPLILHALLNGTSRGLNAWQMAMPPAQLGCAYFNFTSSHDGIGMRPAEGLIPEAEIDTMIDCVKAFGGKVSMRKGPGGVEKPYELNITLFDAFKGTAKGEDAYNVERFLCSQALAMGLEGIPAFYIHCLLATHNDYEGMERLGYNRAINRHSWNYEQLQEQLADRESVHSRVFTEMKRLIALRCKQPAFHPNATQFTLQLGDEAFGVWRQSLDRDQSIFAINNMTDREIAIPVYALNLIGNSHWGDLLTDESISLAADTISFAPYQTRWITNRH